VAYCQSGGPDIRDRDETRHLSDLGSETENSSKSAKPWWGELPEPHTPEGWEYCTGIRPQRS
jgi:hypothetical protein